MEENFLFSRKEMYIMSHDKEGKAFFLKDAYRRNPMYRYDPTFG